MASLNFIDDVISLLSDKWNSNNVKRPKFTKVWDEKRIGYGSTAYSIILVSIDSETSSIFSLLNGEPNTNDSHDWFHEVSVSIDIRSSESLNHVLKLTDEAMRVIKSNSFPLLNGRQYIRLLPTGVDPLNEEYRNIFRNIIFCNATIINP